MKRPARGFLLGKFMPPHRGHQLLVDFGKNYCERLTVLLCTRACEPIPGALRYGWMRELFPGVDLVHTTEDLPQEPKDHPDFWSIWRRVCQEAAPGPIDVVFASEDYGLRLARELGARFVPVDPARQLAPCSGTRVREDPMGAWDYIPEPVRPYYVRRICLFGPESTGKSTLAAELAAHYGTVYVGEHARPLLHHAAGVCTREDIPRIALGQRAAEDAMARHARRLLFCDTDALTTRVWSEFLFGDCPEELKEEARQRRYDLTFLCDIDVPWVDDGERYLADQRREFFQRCEAALIAHQRPYVVLRGDWEARRRQAHAAVEALLARPSGR